MEFIYVLVLAFIQGVTEFLPISSSAHLVLPAKLLNWPDQGLAFDTAVHLGTLLAVVFYFREDLKRLGESLWKHTAHGDRTSESRYCIYLIVASLPIIPVGFLSRFFVEAALRDTLVIALTTITFGVALLASDLISKKQKDDLELNLTTAIVIGIAQCLALIPGTSRSGITITTALLFNHSRESAARISFLISIPAIAGAAGIKLWDLMQNGSGPGFIYLATGMVMAAIAAYACITLFLDYIARIGYLPFVIYRLMLGGLLLAFFI